MVRVVSQDQKNAMQRGRQLGSAVDGYLKAIGRPKRRGRKVTVEEMQRRRDDALTTADQSNGLARLKLIQQAADLGKRITEQTTAAIVDIGRLEAAFVDCAAEYADRQGISYSTWREVGVPADVLKAAGIRRTR